MRGDIIRIKSGLIRHFGVDVGDGTIVHRGPEGANARKGLVVRTSLVEFSGGAEVEVADPLLPALPRDVVVRRALAAVGTPGYELFSANCEHFARGTATGFPLSLQANYTLVAGIVVAIGALVAIEGLAGRRRASRLV